MLKHTDQKLPATTNARKAVVAALLLTGIAQINTAHAVLATGDFLSITRGTYAGGVVTGGSFFVMDMNGDGTVGPTEKTPLSFQILTKTNQFVGNIVIGTTFTATGSHTGAITGNETPAFDVWSFFSNTGMNYFRTTAVTDYGNGTLNFGGWTVTWNGIPAIDMSTNAWQPGGCADCTGWTFTNGKARFQGGLSNGAAYTLDYSATVPNGDVSGFGNVKYYLHLAGNVTIVGALSSSAGTVTAGSLGATRVNSSALVTQDNANSSIVHKDGLYYDFVITGLTGGEQVNVVIPLSTPLPASAVYRKYNASTGLWSTFTEDASNAVKSAAGTPDACPAAGSGSYTAGLTAGRYCIQLTILNGGANDSGSSALTIVDPGGIAVSATPAATFVDTRAGSTGGCSLSSSRASLADRGEWWLVLGFVAWLGMVFRRRQSRA